jgi:hypothetical protein
VTERRSDHANEAGRNLVLFCPPQPMLEAEEERTAHKEEGGVKTCTCTRTLSGAVVWRSGALLPTNFR